MTSLISKKGIIVLLIMNGISFIGVFIQNCLNTGLPYVLADFNIDANYGQMLPTFYLLIVGIATLLSPAMYARWNTRRIVLASIWFVTIGIILSVFSVNFPMLILSRSLQAFGNGLYLSGIYLIFNHFVASNNRGKVLGIVNFFVNFSPIISVVASGYIIDNLGWKSVFMIALLPMILLLALSYKFIDDYSDKKDHIFDLPSFILVALGAGLFLYSCNALSDNYNVIYIFTAIIGVFALWFFIKRQKNREKPFIDLSALNIIPYRNALIIACFISALCNCCKIFIPVFLYDAMALSATDTAMLLLPGTICTTVIPPLLGKHIDKKLFTPILFGGIGFIFIACMLFIFFTSSSLQLLCVFFALYSIGTTAVSFCMTVCITNSLPQNELTHGTCLFTSSKNLASSFCTAIAFGIYAIFFNEQANSYIDVITGTRSLFIFLAILCLILLIFTFKIFFFNKKNHTEIL